MSVHLPLYEDLHVVSDLHLGGTSEKGRAGGIRIFKSGKELAALIKYLAEGDPPCGGQRALVLNGDVIDSLAEDIEHYVASPDEAERILKAIMIHDDFKMVWNALGEFVSKPKHRLVICIGNHDLEIAYPNVQEQIVTYLARQARGQEEAEDEKEEEQKKEEEAVRGRIHFSTTGAGHACRVGDEVKSARVLCIHGNEYDEWNAVSPTNMARLVRSSCLGAEAKIADEAPNPGTKLVIDVMNEIKQVYPFVDLLKPEKETVFNILVTLDPSKQKRLLKVLKLLVKAVDEGGQRVRDVLGGSGDEAERTSAPLPDWKPGGHFGAFLGEPSSSSDLLNEAWKMSASEMPAEDEELDELLGIWQAVGIRFKYLFNRVIRNKRKALRHALLDWIDDDKTWKIDGPDEICDHLEKFELDVDVVIAGHTHLRRQKQATCRAPDMPLKRRSYLYLNTGTWARLMRLERELLKTPKAFLRFWKTLEKKTMEALDKDDSNVVKNLGTVGVVRLKKNGKAASVVAAVCEKKSDKEKAPEPVEKSGGWQEVEIHG